MTSKHTIGVIGLGKFGLPLALTFAQADHQVIVWDKSVNVRNSIEAETSPIDEPFVQGMIEQNELIFATPSRMATQANIVFVAVPTPPREDGSLDASAITSVIKQLAPGGSTNLPIVIVSTVSPGTCCELQILAAHYGLRLAYMPIIGSLGTIVRDLANPDVQIIGHSGDGAGHLTVTTMHSIANSSPRYLMSYESAELAVLAAHTFNAFKVNFANLLGRLCEQYGGNVDNVLDTLALHRSIGGTGLTAGAGFGGPDVPDIQAFSAAGGATVASAIERLNKDHLKWTVTKIRKTRTKTYAIIGRSFKEGSNYRINSFGDQLSDELNKFMTQTMVGMADVVIMALPLRTLNVCEVVRPGAVVIDLWRSHPYLAVCDVVYVPFGI